MSSTEPNEVMYLEKETSREEIVDSPLFEGDEALRLVGTQAQTFSEEYNRTLRNKLVCPFGDYYNAPDLLID
jgi:ACS family allantoate permease-like MFS transporter